MNSAPSLLQERVTQDLLDPWSRAWSTGSVREAEVKPCKAGAKTSPRTEAGSPEHRRQPSPLVVGVGMGLGGWGWGWAGGEHLLCWYQLLTLQWLPSGEVVNFFYLKIHIALHLQF